LREIPLSEIKSKVKELCLEANIRIRPDVLDSVKKVLLTESSEAGRNVLNQIIRNAEIAEAERMPICQDTGYVGVFVEIGCEVKLVDDLKSGDSNGVTREDVAVRSIGGMSGFNKAINEAIAEAYREGSFRKSMVSPPIINRVNTRDNTSAFVYTEIIDGDRLKITVMPKGGGTENASQLKMLPVSGDVEAVKQFVIEVAENAAKSCPPIIIGIGIGGSFDKVGLLAKKALMRPLNSENPDPLFAWLERELLDSINNLGIGPAGLGGNITALGVKIETAPTHIACLPVAVAFNCIAARQAEAVL
jgi:fumarate hydratase subunit alpha